MKHLFWAISCLLVASVQQAHAEGSTVEDGVNFRGGNNGINRVIYTGPGYSAVEGDVSISFSMATNRNGTYESEIRDLPVIGRTGMQDPVMPILNKPSAYLGGEFGGAQADGGYQFEPLTAYGIDPGWSLFLYVDGVNVEHPADAAKPVAERRRFRRLAVNPRIINPRHPLDPEGMHWRGGAGNLSNGQLRFEADANGRVSLISASIGGKFWATLDTNQIADPAGTIPNSWRVSAAHPVAPWSDVGDLAPRVFTPNYANANVKRVSALTRPSPRTSELDGSQTNVTWSNARITPNGGAMRGWSVPVGLPARSVPLDVDQTRTGYDAPRTGNLSLDRRYKGQKVRGSVPGEESRSIVQMSIGGPGAFDNALRAPHATPPSPALNPRYDSETVRFNLGMLARPVGSPIQ